MLLEPYLFHKITLKPPILHEKTRRNESKMYNKQFIKKLKTRRELSTFLTINLKSFC